MSMISLNCGMALLRPDSHYPPLGSRQGAEPGSMKRSTVQRRPRARGRIATPGRPAAEVRSADLAAPSPTAYAGAGTDPYWRLVGAFLVGYPPHSSRACFGDLTAWYAWCASSGVH